MGKEVKLNLDSERREGFENKSSPMAYTMKPTREQTCVHIGKQQCKNGECVLSISMCPEQNNISQSTMLIMVIVGLTIVIFLIILYCLQQRGRNRMQSLSAESHTDQNSSGEVDNNIDNLSLYLPPPPYEEVVSSSIYPNTRIMHQRMNSFTLNVPPTPPPNYNAALNILARSQEIVSTKGNQIPSTQQKQPSIRRCQSEEVLSPHLLPEASLFTFTQIPQMNENR
ncbi:unnamed protein product [Acanthosepion pharaonis]|uniref:Uncharacterized protein n=1 Tax=Acanthosepion pharaonis TaxID=158019 RepID=A0A812E3U9_ACAPH|nr:unnamed protein product [Sepia pharaonis]